MKNRLLFLILLFSVSSLFGQFGMGQWKEHLPYRKSLMLVEGKNRLFCLTESGLFSYSFEDNRVLTHSKIDGLSDVGIQTLAYDNASRRLLIAYQNGNVDLLKEKEVINIPDIKQANLSGNSSIYSVLFHENQALLGTGFGIVVLNPDKAEVADTYYIGEEGVALQVNDLARDDQFLWAATAKGLYRADLNTANLSDYSNWMLQSNLTEAQLACKFVRVFNDKVFLVRSLNSGKDQVQILEDGTWKQWIPELPEVHSIRIFDAQVWIVTGGALRIYNEEGSEVQRISKLGNELLGLRDAIQTAKGTRYFADYGRAVLEPKGEQYTVIRPEGPQYIEIEKMAHGANAFWTLRGGRDTGSKGKEYPAEIGYLQDIQWREISSETDPLLQNVNDLLSLQSNTLNTAQMYLGSWGQGLLLVEGEKVIQKWDSGNSPLGNGEVRIADMASDPQGNLWVLDAGTSTSVKVKDAKEEWHALEYAPLSNQEDLRKILVTSDGDKWVLTGMGKALFALNENHTIGNRDDDVYRSFQVRDENQQLLTLNILDMEEDKEGSIWLGTDKGVMVYTQPGNLLRDRDFYAYRPIIDLDGNNQYLLGTEKVQCIAVDGANQKWLGTQNSGVFLVSPSGDEQLLHFHAENSPLLSNSVHSISIDPQSGVVFFATDKGLISYKGAVTEGGEDFGQLYVFPNPVRETYHGDVVVSGLMADASVKITDVSGNLVFEGEAQGGQMLWDGRNFSGNRVQTGVYLIFCASPDGSRSKVIKLLFIH